MSKQQDIPHYNLSALEIVDATSASLSDSVLRAMTDHVANGGNATGISQANMLVGAAFKVVVAADGPQARVIYAQHLIEVMEAILESYDDSQPAGVLAH